MNYSTTNQYTEDTTAQKSIDTNIIEKTSIMTNPNPIGSSETATKTDTFTAKTEPEARPCKSELIFLWFFFACLVILSVLAGYLLLKKISLTP